MPKYIYWSDNSGEVHNAKGSLSELRKRLKTKPDCYICAGNYELKYLIKEYTKNPAYFNTCHKDRIIAIKSLVNYASTL